MEALAKAEMIIRNKYFKGRFKIDAVPQLQQGGSSPSKVEIIKVTA